MSSRYLKSLGKRSKYFQMCPSLPTAAWSGLAFACDENGVAHQIHNLLPSSSKPLKQSAWLLHVQSDTKSMCTCTVYTAMTGRWIRIRGQTMEFHCLKMPIANSRCRASSQFSTPKAFGFKACETGEENKHKDWKKERLKKKSLGVRWQVSDF